MEKCGYPAFHVIKTSVGLETGDTAIQWGHCVFLRSDNIVFIFLSRNNSPTHNPGSMELH